MQDELITDSGLKLYLDPSYNKEWTASVTGTIAALPINPLPKDKKIIDQLSIGYEVTFSYRVVASFDFKGDGLRFHPATEENPHMREWTNGNGEWLKVYAMPKFTGISKIQWVGVYQDRSRKVLSGMQGTEMEVERWLSQFQIGKTDDYTFNNFFSYNGEDYWRCDPSDIFAKKVNGHLVAVGDRVICKPIEEDVPREILQSIQHTSSVKIRYTDRAKVLTGGKAKGIKRDMIVGFNPQVCEKYQFYNKDYYLIKENFITGIWN